MRGLALRRTWPFALWLIALALVPWWLGLPLLLGIATTLLMRVERLHDWQGRLRLALRWGLPGVAFALGHGFAEAALGWTVAAVAALAGFTLLAGLETWLDRHRRAGRADAPAPPAVGQEWPARVLSPPPAGSGIIELAPPRWQAADAVPLAWPAGADSGHLRYVREPGFAGFRLDDGRGVQVPPGRCAIEPGGDWMAVEVPPGVLLWNCREGAVYRLRRRSLCGWHAGRPWLQSGPGEMPVPLDEALRREPAE
ncbi:MAG TPA: hypothetical protein VFR91_04715 [Dyella sp.]|nr:hypothetical protein [Dyella sp.]